MSYKEECAARDLAYKQVDPVGIHDRLGPMSLDQIVTYVWNASRVFALQEAVKKDSNWINDLKELT
jgi:hypothetical protein